MADRPRVGAVVALAVAALVLLPNLGGYPLLDPDEGRHAEVAREVLTAPSWRGWIVPTLGGEPYYDKPMLFYWLATAAYRVAGVDETGARLTSVVAALGTVALTSGLGAAAWGARAGMAAGIVLATSLGFVGIGRLATLDMTLLFFITASLAAFRRWLDVPRPGHAALAGLAAGLGMLTKGLVAPALVATTAGVFLVVRRDAPRPDVRSVAAALAAFLLVTAPWHVAAAWVDPAYLRTFYFRHHLERLAGETVQSHTRPIWFYAHILAVGCLPWTGLLPAAFHAALARGARERDGVLCAIWTAVVVGLFSLSPSKLPTYVLPALPPVALLTGRFAAAVATGTALPRTTRRLALAGIAVTAAAFVVAPFALWLAAGRAYGGIYAARAPLALLMLLPAAALLVAVRRRRLDAAAPILAATMLGLVAMFSYALAPLVAAVRSAGPIAATIAAAGVPADVPLVAFGVRAPSLLFYTHRRVVLTDRPRDLRALRADHALVLVVTSPRHVPHLGRTGPWHVWHDGPRTLLLGSIPSPFLDGRPPST